VPSPPERPGQRANNLTEEAHGSFGAGAGVESMGKARTGFRLPA
jgi:hypothetical protein